MASPYLKDGKWYLRWKDDSGRWRGMVSTARTKAEARRPISGSLLVSTPSIAATRWPIVTVGAADPVRT